MERREKAIEGGLEIAEKTSELLSTVNKMNSILPEKDFLPNGKTVGKNVDLIYIFNEISYKLRELNLKFHVDFLQNASLFFNSEETKEHRKFNSHDFQGGFSMEKIIIPNVNIPAFKFTMPFCGHVKPQYNPDFALPRDRYFAERIKDSIAEYRLENGMNRSDGFPKSTVAFIGFLHSSVPNSRFGGDYDADNIYTKMVIDTLRTAGFFRSDNARKTSITYMGKPVSKGEQSKTEVFIADIKAALFLYNMMLEDLNAATLAYRNETVGISTLAEKL